MLSRITEAGFVEVGKWELRDKRPAYSLDKEATSYKVLYAFVSGDDVLYVGKTTIALRDRLYQYQRPGPSQRTNIRVNALLTEVLSNGETVRIFALPDRGEMEYHGFHLNLAAGIEDSVIKELQPQWNKTGR
jgi:hypothetical protein